MTRYNLLFSNHNEHHLNSIDQAMIRLLTSLLFVFCFLNSISQEWNNIYGDINYENEQYYTVDVCRYITFNENGLVVVYSQVDSIVNPAVVGYMEIGFDGVEHFRHCIIYT